MKKLYKLDSSQTIRRYTCPVCKQRYVAYVTKTLDVNMKHHFPGTYGQGMLICDNCLPARLEALQDD